MLTDYSLVLAGADGTEIGHFDNWPAARQAWQDIRNKRAVRLLCMWPCGCLRQAIRTTRTGAHSGWRRIDACDGHKRKRATLHDHTGADHDGLADVVTSTAHGAE